ncbi:MAG: dTDP-glucose 4,6-dehydratase [Candidatus Dadabacteria bacterium]|nr:MAG: dTDP-glucose 4,6-dehydratase [Candidatus Dadabacteria bacterium]
MNVLVTGGAGFIGSNFVHYLRRERPSWKVTVLDLLTYAGNLKNIAELVEEGSVRFVKGSIADKELVDDLFKGTKFNLVFNFAAESHVDRSIHGAQVFVETNIMGTQILLDAARATGVERFVQISTDEVYGSLGPTGFFVETTPLNPTSPYAASKTGADLMVLAAVKTHGLEAVITRCSNNYGPYQFPEKLMPLFITNALEDKPLPLYGDGLNVRSWIYVEDHCAALLLCGEKGRSGEVYNIGAGADGELPNIEVTKTILSILGKSEDLIQYVADRPAHDRRYAIDYSKIKSELGWEPKISFREGVQRTVEWYKNNKEWWQSVKTGEYLKYYEMNYANR